MKTPVKPTRTVAYLRVSTDAQAERGISLQAQRAKVEAYAALYDLELVAVEVDAGLSAKTLDRPALQRALSALKRGDAEAVLVVKLDRLTRSVRDLGWLVETYFAEGKWSLLSVGENIDTRSAAGRLVLNVLASVAQWERETTGERTSAALRHKKAKGEYTGGRTPYGYSLGEDGQLVPVEEEQKVIAAAKRLSESAPSLRAIAEKLAELGCTSRSGQAFHPEQVRRILKAA